MLSLCVKLLCKEAGGAGGGEGARDTESKTTRRTGNRSHKTHVFFFFLNVILPQCRADLMIGNPGKTWGAFFGFSASSLQRMRSNMSRSQRSQRS